MNPRIVLSRTGREPRTRTGIPRTNASSRTGTNEYPYQNWQSPVLELGCQYQKWDEISRACSRKRVRGFQKRCQFQNRDQKIGNYYFPRDFCPSPLLFSDSC